MNQAHCIVVVFVIAYAACLTVGIMAAIPLYPFQHRELSTTIPLCVAGALGIAVTSLALLDPTRVGAWK
jgi:hypothetical protein